MTVRRFIASVLALAALIGAIGVWLAGSVRADAAPAGAIARPRAALPELALTVRETAGVTRSAEIVRSGVPLSRSLGVTGTAHLALIDNAGSLAPAEFTVLARWHAGLNDPSAPIQWLLLTFPADVAAHASAAYRLVLDGSRGENPAPPRPLTVIQHGGQITVDTGAAMFVLGAGALFDAVLSADGSTLAGGSPLTATVDGGEYRHTTLRRASVERAGPLSAVVVIEGAYDMPAVGGGGLGSSRRYVFTAGSPVAQVRHALSWEGDRCYLSLTCAEGLNAILLAGARDALSLGLPAPYTVTAVGDFQAPPLIGLAGATDSAAVRQNLRISRTMPLSFDARAPGDTAAGREADGGLLAVSSPTATLAVALNHMHRYEPQAVQLLAGGRLAVDWVGDTAYLGYRQGAFATFAVGAWRGAASRAELDRLVWAPLNHPLRAWPSPADFAASGAVDEFPTGTLTGDLAAYDALVSGVLTLTRQQIGAKGLPGLMTFGVYPRYWGDALYYDEVDCSDNDPTPGVTWDNTYWCSTWTDYHNTTATAVERALRTGEVEWLDELASPAALRTLHTQIMQCAPGDPWFYCGQAPAGYGGYRSDFNSSHAYFDNLFLYYWLTGDETVVRTVQRGASTMRDYLCARRPASACLPTDPPSDPWSGPTGRVAMQWESAFRFVGLAGDDPGYLDDYTANLARAVTQFYAQVAPAGGADYGFWLLGSTPITDAGAYSTDQLWMVSLYDMNLLHRLQQDTGDAPLGQPPVRPSQVQAAWARTLADFGSTVAGDGTVTGTWPNALYVTWSGPHIGGDLITVTANTSFGDPYLWNSGKACLTAVVARAARQTGDPGLRQMSADLTRLALAEAIHEIAPLGKVQGLYQSRLHAAVAGLAEAPPVRRRVFVPLAMR